MNYSPDEKNRLFKKLQDYVQSNKLSLQNMVDLHDILTSDKPTYSHNKGGTLYIASKYSNETFERIEELINWVEKHVLSDSNERVNNMSDIVTSIIDETDPIQEDEIFGKDKRFKNTFGNNRYKAQKIRDITKENEAF